MVRTGGFRLVAAILGLTTGLTASGIALAHGAEHREPGHPGHGHASDTHLGAHARAGTGAPRMVDEDHAHVRTGLAPTVRPSGAVSAVVVRHYVVFDETAAALGPVAADIRLPGPAPPDHAPTRPRAPPFL